MHPFFIYLIQVNIALALFYLLYTFVLKKDTFLRIKRLFFLSAIVFSLFYPLFSIPALSEMWPSPRHENDVEVGVPTVIIGEPTAMMVGEDQVTAPVSIPWTTVISYPVGYERVAGMGEN